MAIILNFAFLIFNSPQAQAQIISTFAGNHTAGYTGNGGQATAAELNQPYGVAFDAAGNVYIADALNNRIRVVSTAGIISTIAGNGIQGYSGDGGAATAAELYYPGGISVDAVGNLYMVDDGNNRIRKVTTAGIISAIAGNGTLGYTGDGGQATAAELDYPAGVALDAAGNIYISDSHNYAIRRINTAGIISTFAGNGTAGYAGDGGQATAATLNYPTGIVFDASGNLYISDVNNQVIRKVNTAGIISTIAGNGTYGYTGNGGQATAATLSYPYGVAVDASGNLYIADYYNSAIRKVNTAGIISTYAGNGTAAYTGDGGQATAAALNKPYGVSLDAAGNVYIADENNNVIRKVCVSTCAGAGIDELRVQNLEFRMWPNPTSSMLNLELGIQNGSTELQVTDILGNEVIHNSEIVNQKCTLDVGGLNAGVYFLNIKTAGNMLTKKFVVQR